MISGPRASGFLLYGCCALLVLLHLVRKASDFWICFTGLEISALGFAAFAQ